MPAAHRLFFAIRPPAPERSRIGLVRDALKAADAAVADAQLHVTLAITDDYAEYPEAVATRMQRIGDGLAGDPFPLTLDRLAASATSVALRPSSRPAALTAMQRRLGDAMAYWAMSRANWSFNPHVTLAYRRGDPLLLPIPAITWEVREIVLIHSVVGSTRHIDLGCWTLVPDQHRFIGF